MSQATRCVAPLTRDVQSRTIAERPSGWGRARGRGCRWRLLLSREGTSWGAEKVLTSDWGEGCAALTTC